MSTRVMVTGAERLARTVPPHATMSLRRHFGILSHNTVIRSGLVRGVGGRIAMAEQARPSLEMRDGRLTLVGDGLELCGDFSQMVTRLRHDRLGKELLVRAARVRGVEHPRAVDATAGLGEDSLLLAAAGFCVTLFERDPIIAALLCDAMARAREVPELVEPLGRMDLKEEDSVEGMRHLDAAPDVVFLDPMFPERRKSAAVKKKLQLIQRLEQPCEDEGRLLEAALSTCPRKVIVKRPIKGPYLAGAKPSHSLRGKAVRYDVYVPQR